MAKKRRTKAKMKAKSRKIQQQESISEKSRIAQDRATCRKAHGATRGSKTGVHARRTAPRRSARLSARGKLIVGGQHGADTSAGRRATPFVVGQREGQMAESRGQMTLSAISLCPHTSCPISAHRAKHRRAVFVELRPEQEAKHLRVASNSRFDAIRFQKSIVQRITRAARHRHRLPLNALRDGAKVVARPFVERSG